MNPQSQPLLLLLLAGALAALGGCQAQDGQCSVTPVRNLDDFNSALRTTALVVVHYPLDGNDESKKDAQYFANLCTICHNAKFFEANQNQVPEVAQYNHVKDVSTVQIFKNGIMVSEFEGPLEKSELESELRRLQ
ncbi:thioredoxin-like [Rhinatrema bivittatum]|uniref:thioredoxin-like n=1 Tax=Rhinatrema bivittatum TaxID=194408 RepID=UPI0011263D01|nr:thioredoxin-like [Rhinatrema bivittatum]